MSITAAEGFVAARDQDGDAVAGDAERAWQLQRVGNRHQAGAAGRRIGELAAVLQLFGDEFGGSGDRRTLRRRA